MSGASVVSSWHVHPWCRRPFMRTSADSLPLRLQGLVLWRCSRPSRSRP